MNVVQARSTPGPPGGKGSDPPDIGPDRWRPWNRVSVVAPSCLSYLSWMDSATILSNPSFSYRKSPVRASGALALLEKCLGWSPV